MVQMWFVPQGVFFESLVLGLMVIIGGIYEGGPSRRSLSQLGFVLGGTVGPSHSLISYPVM